MNRLLSGILSLLLVLPCVGARAQGSQFIEDLPTLTQDPDRPGAMGWEAPGFDRSAYSRLMIEPITIFVSPDSAYKGLSADDLQALASGFRDAVTTALQPEITVVDEAGPGVLYVRAALTDVKLEKKKRGLLGYTPVGIVVTAARDVAGKRISLRDAVLEAELLDAASGERLGVLIDHAPRTGDDDKLDWGAIEKSFVYYAERLKMRLQAAQAQ